MEKRLEVKFFSLDYFRPGGSGDILILYSLDLTVGLWPDVKNGFTWKIIIVLNVRGGHGK